MFSISSALGRIGFRLTLLSVFTKPQVQIGASRGQVQPFSRAAIPFLTILSSREWKLITHSLPPGLSLSGAVSIIFSTAPSSSLTAMRIA